MALTMQDHIPPPPTSFDDFTYGFDPNISNLFPSPPPLPSSADLFSPSETTDLLGFLDNFSWDVDAEVQNALNYQPSPQHLPPHDRPPTHPPMSLHSALTMSMSHPQNRDDVQHEGMAVDASSERDHHDSASTSRPERRPSTTSSTSTQQSNEGSGSGARPKPLLSTPQKRLNHIMSEQKRRNAIRDGYVQLTNLLAPAGAPPGAGMPTRGRPKGSGTRAGGRKGTGGFKGKSGILFRAVEYIQWLEEGRDALFAEVQKTENAAGIRHS